MKKIEMNDKKFMAVDEKLDFLYKLVNWEFDRKSGIVERTTQMMNWNIAIFGLFFVYNKIDDIVILLKKGISMQNNIMVIVVSFMSLLVIIGMVFCAISLYGFFNLHKLRDVECFSIDDIVNNSFDKNRIVDDYYSILKDNDKICEEIAYDLTKNIKFMFYGSIYIFVSEILVGVIVAIYK